MSKEEPITEAACRSNISYFQAQCKKYTQLALEARVEELRYQYMLLMKVDPEAALEELKSTEPVADPGYN